MEVSMFPIARNGLTELAIIIGVAGLACSVLVLGAAVLSVIVLNRRKPTLTSKNSVPEAH